MQSDSSLVTSWVCVRMSSRPQPRLVHRPPTLPVGTGWSEWLVMQQIRSVFDDRSSGLPEAEDCCSDLSTITFFNETDWHYLGTSWDAAMQTSLHFNKAIGPCHDLQTDLPCLYVLNHGLWHKWNCLHRCPTRYGGIGSQSLQKYAKLLATKVSNDSIQICRVLFVVRLFQNLQQLSSISSFPASRWRALQLHKKRMAARRRAWKQARENVTNVTRQSLQLFLLLHAYFRWISGSVSVQFYWHLMLYIRCTRSCLTDTCHSSPPWPVPES